MLFRSLIQEKTLFHNVTQDEIIILTALYKNYYPIIFRTLYVTFNIKLYFYFKTQIQIYYLNKCVNLMILQKI